MRFILLLIVLLIFVEFSASAKNHVDDDDDDVDSENDNSDEDEEEEDEESAEKNNKNENKNRVTRKNTKNRRMFGARLPPGRVRLRGPRPIIPVARPPILLLPPTVQIPQPVYVGAGNVGVRQPPLFNFSAPGVVARGLIQSPFSGQPPMSAQAMNPGFSIANVRSAVIHNAVSAAPPNTFVVTPQITSIQATPFPQLIIPQPKQIVRISPPQDKITQPAQSIQPANSIPSFSLPPAATPVANSLDVAPSPPMEPPPPPPSDYTAALADEIHCMRNPDRVSALLTAPPGYSALPFFNGRPDIDPQSSKSCRITSSAGSNVYQLEVTELENCGVSFQQENDGKEWLSISIRFPLVSGLKTPEDEVITIKCKPQDRTASANHAVDFHGNLVSPPATSRSSVFLGQDRDLQCDLGLFRKAPGNSDYVHRVNAGSAIELGQELKLRAAVKAGDGWNYVRLTDVIIYRVPPSFNSQSKVQLLEASKRNNVHNNNPRNVQPDATVEYAHLVLTDGCRNSAYKAIAPIHPEVDPTNSLVVEFNFKAFMFQTMTEGEAVRITARVTACVEQQDCSITHCPDGLQTNGRRRRDMSNVTVDETNNNTTDFDRNLTVVVLTANNREDEWLQKEYLIHKLQKEQSCPGLLVSTVGLAVALSISWILGLSLALVKWRRNKIKAKSKWGRPSKRTLWTDTDDSGKDCLKVSDISYLAKKRPTNNLNIDVDTNPAPKVDVEPSLKRTDSILRTLQTFIAASMFNSFSQTRNVEETESKRKSISPVLQEPKKVINKDASSRAQFNTFKAQEKNNKAEELFVALV